MKIIAVDDDNNIRTVPGPADLAELPRGASVFISGEPDEREQGRWAAALGMHALRGGEIRRL